MGTAPFKRVIIDFPETGRDGRQLRCTARRQLILDGGQAFRNELARFQLVGPVLVEKRDLTEARLRQ
ncbi:hypothetical protein GCM10020258_56240 [Sphingomonas yabuuchiae]